MITSGFHPFSEYHQVLVFFALPEPFAHRFGIPCEPAYNPAEDIEFQLELRGIPVLPVQHVPVLEVTFGQCHEIPAGLALAALRWYRMFIAAVQLLHIREKIPAAVLRQPRSAIRIMCLPFTFKLLDWKSIRKFAPFSMAVTVSR